MNRQPITIDFVWRSRLIEARRTARVMVWNVMLTNPDSEKRRLLRRIYQRLCD